MTLRRAANTSLAFLLFLLVFCAFCGFSCARSSAQPRRVQEHLRGVLTRAKLVPEIRANATIHYSPDGNYLFVQDPAGVLLFSRNPLQLVTYIDAPRSYPARFSPDSKTLTLLTFDLFLSRWRVADGKQIEALSLTIPDGCLSATISPGADLLACSTPDMQLAIYRLADARKVFSSSIRNVSFGFAGVPIPLDSTTDFSAPFGFFLSNSINRIANRGLFHLPVWFSPDGKFLVAGDDSNSLRVNLSNFTKESFSSPLHKRMYAINGLAPDDRALLLDRVKAEPPSVVSFSTGHVISSFPGPADSAQLCTNPRFAIFRSDSDSSIQLGDLNSTKTTLVPDGLAADVFGSEVAVLKRNGTVLFFKYGESKSFAGVRLPLDSLPPLHAAAVDSALSTLALSVDGTGGSYDVASGKLLLEHKAFVGAQFLDRRHPLLLGPRRIRTPQQILRGDFDAHSSETSWTAQSEAEILPGEARFLEYSVSNEFGRGMLVVLDRSGVAFTLRGLDPASGAQSWRAKFDAEIPIPFSDPQGSRFVLGWRAKTQRARSAVKNNPSILDAFKHSKRMEQDSVFEAFDTISGKSLGGVFVQFGDGPVNFSSAFSVGDFIFLVKDDIRVTVISLRDGKIIVRAKGFQPSTSAQSNLLALDEGMGRLGIYDLLTGQKIEEQFFGDNLAYKHFSADGKKLLVLTSHQEVFVLDMSDVREHPLAPQRQAPDPSVGPADQLK